MYKNLDRVTFTGADDSVLGEEIIEIAKKYPKTEWGILFGASNEGANRFPSREWLEREVPIMAKAGLQLCGHLCGRHVNDLVLRGDFTWLYLYPDELTKLFKRIQINFHGMEYDPARSFLPRIEDEPFQFIFQQDDKNNWIYQEAIDDGLKNVFPLFDVSHGAGVLPEDNSWPIRKKTEFMGYAGGLGPDNIREQLALIDKAAGNHGPFWIDMETKVRSNRDRKFDLDKVNQVCKEIWG
jgi:hypothetical protein